MTNKVFMSDIKAAPTADKADSMHAISETIKTVVTAASNTANSRLRAKPTNETQKMQPTLQVSHPKEDNGSSNQTYR